MSIEEWRSVGSYPGYEASSTGRIRALRSGVLVIVPSRLMANGYRYVSIRQNGRRKTTTVHSLVTEAFHGPRPDGMQVRHLDGTRTNNAPENLRWGTASENAYDSVRHGTHHMVRRVRARTAA